MADYNKLNTIDENNEQKVESNFIQQLHPEVGSHLKNKTSHKPNSVFSPSDSLSPASRFLSDENRKNILKEYCEFLFIFSINPKILSDHLKQSQSKGK